MRLTERAILRRRVTTSARRMGYATSPNTIQSILAGHKKRTRGFVYSALLEQFLLRERERGKLFGLGIYQLQTLSTAKVSSVKAELYCRRMELVVKP